MTKEQLMNTPPKRSLRTGFRLLHERVLRIVVTGVSAASLVVALVCGATALTPVKEPADSAFYSFAGVIALAALVLFMLAGGVILQLRMLRILTGAAAGTCGHQPPSEESQ